MARLGELIAAVWAAVWVRWELMRARRSRRAARRDRAGDELVLPIMAVPVEGVDYEPVELDDDLRRRLEATAAELVERAPAAPDSPSRRRRPLAAVAASVGALLAVAVVGASATALIAGSTGVPAVDKLLGIWESGLERDTVPDRQGVGPADVRPAEPGPTLAYGGEDGPAGEVTSFVGRSGEICMVHSFEGRATGTVACQVPVSLGRYLDTEALRVFELEATEEQVAVLGQVRADVETVSATGPMGPMDVQIGERWEVDGVPEGMRPFVAVGELSGVASRDAGSAAARLDRYSFSVERGAETVTVSPR